MSTINFICSDAQKEELKAGVWELILNHYLSTAFPNTNAEYTREGKDVYRTRMDQLMHAELCYAEETEGGLAVEFDSTEDAGFSIAESVYGTNMGYSDEGLCYLIPLFEGIVRKFPHIPFEADTECINQWNNSEDHFSYDGEVLAINGIDVEKYKLVTENMSLSPEEISEKTGLPLDEVMDVFDLC